MIKKYIQSGFWVKETKDKGALDITQEVLNILKEGGLPLLTDCCTTQTIVDRNYADEAEAISTGNLKKGQFYHTDGVIKIVTV